MTRIACLLALLLSLVVASAPARAAPLEAYGKLPLIEAAAVSPSGHAVAMILTNGESRLIVVQDLASNTITTKVTAGSAKVRALRWAGDRHLLVVTSVTAAPMFILNARREWTLAFLLDLQTSKVRQLLRDLENGMNTVFDVPVVREVEGKPVVFAQGVRFVNNRGRLGLYRIDLETAKSREVEGGSEDTVDWLVDANGRPVAQELYDGLKGRWTLKVPDRSGWRETVTVDAPITRPYTVSLGRDGRSVLYAMSDETGFAWREARLDGAPPGAPIADVEGLDPIVDTTDGRLVGHIALVGDDTRYTFFDPADDRAWKAVLKAYAGDAVALRSWSKDRKKIVVIVDSAMAGPAYALIDLNTREGTWLGPEYVDLSPADVAIKEPVRFKARDGLELSGYITRPRGGPANNLPLIVYPHGGPAARDGPGFDWWAQAMASRGYAVLQVNYRGSDGLGEALLQAGFGEWGRKMQTDLSDGVRHLAARGTIDPKRVCIVGASYGGYAALAGATIDRGVYRCAVSVAGISDLRRQISYARSRGGRPAERYWNRFLGVSDEASEEVLETYSPARLADRVEIPVLLIHGKDDSVVPLEQSQIMATALQKAGKPVELVVQKGEDHWLSRGETRLQMLTATMAFVEKHNPPN
ncbi:MAG: S9 family peptidase [Phenylobacterium sp.]|uniref:S9 family peptidase n=1 Tax=Phenylobacterium sp. TaxID=1871053 RepID=UPI001A454BCC|nr:S9 family peptidase [Phenylobacterium sp.]MBL8769932.1 S9 family peptidase [Phenylobacterium sp.]